MCFKIKVCRCLVKYGFYAYTFIRQNFTKGVFCMNKKIDIEDIAFKLQMLLETFIAIEEGVESTRSELPRHYLYMPVVELKRISDEMNKMFLE